MAPAEREVSWAAVRTSRLALADALDGVALERWDEFSWCEGWRVRDVVGHVIANAEGAFVLRRALPGLVRFRFQIDKFVDADARRRGQAEPQRLLARLRQSAGGCFLPPGRKPEDVLSDVLVHTQDALRPLGVDRHAAADALRLALDRTVPQKAPPAKNRADGLRLRAADMDWAWGVGPEVTGPGEDILLAVTGRRGALANLTGSGLTRLDSRCPQPASTR